MAKSLVDLLPPDRRQAMEALVAKEGDGWQLPRLGPWPWEQIIREQWGVHDEVDVRWMLARLAATPFRHFTDPRIAPALQPSDSRAPTSAACEYPQPVFDRYAATARATSGWLYREIDCSHHPAITHPFELVDLLEEASD